MSQHLEQERHISEGTRVPSGRAHGCSMAKPLEHPMPHQPGGSGRRHPHVSPFSQPDINPSCSCSSRRKHRHGDHIPCCRHHCAQMPMACPHLHMVQGHEATCRAPGKGHTPALPSSIGTPAHSLSYWYPKRHFGTSYIPGPLRASPCFWHHTLPRDNTGSVPAPNVLRLPSQSASSHPAAVTQPQLGAAGGGMGSVQAGDRFTWTGEEPCQAVSQCQLGNSSRTELMPPAKPQSHLTPGSPSQ